MVDFVRKRLQVFVSSTYSDLIHERQAAVEAILTAGHIPAGMELFSAGDESQMEVIKQWIDESDIYLLILGGRYGSIEPKTGKSYTHLEYEYALAQNKPAFACVIKEPVIETRVKSFGLDFIEREQPQKLKDFREFVLTKMVKFWEDTKDIKITVGETLAHLARREELVGWVRATEQVNAAALADEIARLSKENAVLRAQVESGSSTGVLINGLVFSDLKAILIKKELLDFVVENRVKLLAGLAPYDYPKQIPDLDILGLIQFHQSYKKFVLTDAGRVFLNQIEREELESSN